MTLKPSDIGLVNGQVCNPSLHSGLEWRVNGDVIGFGDISIRNVMIIALFIPKEMTFEGYATDVASPHPSIAITSDGVLYEQDIISLMAYSEDHPIELNEVV